MTIPFITTTTPSNFTTTPPSLKDLLDIWGDNLMVNFNCHHIGTIQSFNSTQQTATATINYQKTTFKLDPLTQKYNPVLTSYPVLTDCPVIVLGGGGANLTFPISPGDTCLVLFNDRDIDNWFNGSNTAGVNTPRLHSFSDGMILVGLNSLLSPILSYDSTRAVLRNSTAMVGVGPSLIKIANSLYTLNGLLQNLITEINSLVTQTAAITVPVPSLGTSGIPNNAAAITAIAAQLSTTASQLGSLLE